MPFPQVLRDLQSFVFTYVKIRAVFHWLAQNYQWVFSGIGVLIVGYLIERWRKSGHPSKLNSRDSLVGNSPVAGGLGNNQNVNAPVIHFNFGQPAPAQAESAHVAPASRQRPTPSAAQDVKAGALYCRAGEAEALIKVLEDVRELYSEKGEFLSQPLFAKTLPNEIKEWRHKQLWRFRILYDWHMHSLKNIDPDFQSKMMNEGFPSETRYLDVMRNLREHASLLRGRADSLANRYSEANEGN
jgi:hypothetical protein